MCMATTETIMTDEACINVREGSRKGRLQRQGTSMKIDL